MISEQIYRITDYLIKDKKPALEKLAKAAPAGGSWTHAD
jgi:hypothetical protein